MSPANRTIVVTGFMASGKTSVAMELARVLGREPIDLDSQVESEHSKTIREIIETEGEANFRVLESAALLHVLSPIAVCLK